MHTLHCAVVRVLNEAEMEQKMTGNGLQIVASSPPQFAAFIREELPTWAHVVRISKAVVN